MPWGMGRGIPDWAQERSDAAREENRRRIENRQRERRERDRQPTNRPVYEDGRDWPGRQFGAPDPWGETYTDMNGVEYKNIQDSKDPWLRSIYQDRLNERAQTARDEYFAAPEGWKPGDPIDFSQYSQEELDKWFKPGTRTPAGGFARDPRQTYNPVSGYRADNAPHTDQMKYEGYLYDLYMNNWREQQGYNTRSRTPYGLNEETGQYEYNPFRDGNTTSTYPYRINQPPPFNGGLRGGHYGAGSMGSSAGGGSPYYSSGGGGGGGGSFGYGGPPDPADYLSDFGLGGNRWTPGGGYGWDQGPWGNWRNE